MQIAVIGSGTMGASIAAHIANCGYQVLLLDLASPSNTRNLLVSKALARIQDKPYALSHPKRLSLIKVGNLTDDIKLLHECDLVIEAIIEKLDAKQELFRTIAPFLNPKCIVASNTSTLLLKALKQGNIWPQTIILHFFNPPQYLPLVELVADDDIKEENLTHIKQFLYHQLGREIIQCADSPGFIANRMGCFFMKCALKMAIENQLDIYKIDKLTNKLLGMPKTGIFGLYDLIGLDVMSMIDSSLRQNLPNDDQYQQLQASDYVINNLVATSKLGLKSGAGFYTQKNGKKLALNLATMEYELCSQDDAIDENYAKYLQDLAQACQEYGQYMTPNLAASIEDIDKTMKLGFNWRIGPSQFSTVLKHGIKHLKEQHAPLGNKLFENKDAQICEYKKAIIFRSKTKFNIITHNVLELLNQAITIAQEQKTKLIIYPYAENFSAGGDLKFFLNCALNQNFKAAEDFLILGQKTFQRIKYSNIPIIAVAQNLALGGGCELLLHCHHVIANINLQAGLVESSIGLIPSWGGIKEIFCRAMQNDLPTKALHQLLTNVIHGYKSRSADYFAEQYLTKTTVIAQKDDALDYAISLDLQKEPTNTKLNLLTHNAISLAELELKELDSHSAFIASKLIKLTKLQNPTEDEILKAERDLFLKLLSQPQTIEKISNILSR